MASGLQNIVAGIELPTRDLSTRANCAKVKAPIKFQVKDVFEVAFA
jgi:hypothetical protein